MLHSNVNIVLSAKALKVETLGYFSIIFERPPNFEYEAGDWMDLEFKSQELLGGKTYSFSSSPSEPDIMITFKEGISPFKKALAAVQRGERLLITQYGNDYGFHLKENVSSTLIAGGVGIAPFRSMLKEMADIHFKNDVHLLYLHQTEYFLFKNELDKWQAVLPHLSITYVVTKGLNRKEKEKTLNSVLGDRRQFYIAGPEGMVTNTEAFLQKMGIEKRSIKVDRFGGY